MLRFSLRLFQTNPSDDQQFVVTLTVCVGSSDIFCFEINSNRVFKLSDVRSYMPAAIQTAEVW
jgi:hypothetical protein